MNVHKILVAVSLVIVLGSGFLRTPGNLRSLAAHPRKDIVFPSSGEKEGPQDKLPDMYDETHRPPDWAPGIYLAGSQSSDQFGYTLNLALPYKWIDATDGVEVFVEGDADLDDGFTGPIDIGFDFKFYEHAYQQLYISTNGLVTFESGSESFANRSIPENTPPDNFIAPFWDDLEVGDGHVFYKFKDSLAGKSFIVEWHQVKHFGGTDPLTFEIVLYENGNIDFQYQSMAGDLESATVGIEDGDGIDGLLHLYNSPGIGAGEAVRFVRPAPAPRVKVLVSPLTNLASSDLLEVEFEVINTNEVGSDIFELTGTVDQPGWSLEFYSVDGEMPLIDSDGDGKADTGKIVHGEGKRFLARIHAPPTAESGNYTTVEIQATSSDNSSVSGKSRLTVAIPASFAQAVADSQEGVYAQLVWEQEEIKTQVSSFFTGNTLSLASSDKGRLIYAWETNGESSQNNQPVYFSDIELTILDDVGRITTPAAKITNNSNESSPSFFINARYPAIAALPNGRFVVLWVQYILDVLNRRTNSNIYFTILNPDGSIFTGPYSVTDNDGWRGDGAEDIPLFSSPHVIATQDNRLVLTWVESKKELGGDTSNIEFIVLGPDGTQLTPPMQFGQSIPGSTLYIDPTLTGLTGARVLLAYSIYNQSAGTYQIAYGILSSDGQVLQDENWIPGAFGWRLDSAQLDGGNILIAWTNPSANRIAYAILNESASHVATSPRELPQTDSRTPDFVSVSPSKDDTVVLTWMDAEWKDFIYYALIGADGEILTPTLILLKGKASNPLIQTSFTGQGIARYERNWRTYLPGICR